MQRRNIVEETPLLSSFHSLTLSSNYDKSNPAPELMAYRSFSRSV